MTRLKKQTALLRILFLSAAVLFAGGIGFETYADQNTKKKKKTVVTQRKKTVPKKETKNSTDAPGPIVDDTPINPKKYNKSDARKPYYDPRKKDSRTKDSLFPSSKKKKKKRW